MELGEPYDVGKLKKTIEFLLDNDETNLIVDLGDLQFLSEESLDAFAVIQKSVSQANGRFAVIAPRKKVRAFLKKSQKTSSLKILSSLQELVSEIDPEWVEPPGKRAGGKSSGAESFEEDVLAPSFEDLQADEVILGEPEDRERPGGEDTTKEDDSQDEPEFLKSSGEETHQETGKEKDERDSVELESLEEQSISGESKSSRPSDEEKDLFGETGDIEMNPLSGDAGGEPEEEVFYSSQNEESSSSQEEDPAFVDPDAVSFSEEAFEPPERGQSEESSEAGQEEKEDEEEGRLGAKDRLRSPTPRRYSGGRSGRMGGRGWSSTKDVEKTGVVYVDDTVQGESVSQNEIDSSAPIFSGNSLTDKSSSKGIIIVMILIMAVIGGLVYLLKSGGTGDVFDKDTDKSEIVEETVPEPTPEVVTEDSGLTPEEEEVASEAKTQVDKSPAPQKKTPRKATPPPRPTRTPSRPAPTSHSVTITSNPSSADVYVNGEREGRTPLTVRLTKSSNRIVLQKEGYKDYVKHLRAQGNQRLNARLTEEARTPRVREEPKKTAPKAVAPKPVPAKKPEPEPVEEEPEEEPEPVVEEEKPEPKKAEPAEKFAGPPSKVFIASKPPGATISVDGRDQGVKTPSWLKLPPGSYQLDLEKGGQKASKSIVIKEGKNKSQYLILK